MSAETHFDPERELERLLDGFSAEAELERLVEGFDPDAELERLSGETADSRSLPHAIGC